VRGDKGAKNYTAIIKEVMTLVQISEAQKISSALCEKYVVPFQKD